MKQRPPPGLTGRAVQRLRGPGLNAGATGPRAQLDVPSIAHRLGVARVDWASGCPELEPWAAGRLKPRRRERRSTGVGRTVGDSPADPCPTRRATPGLGAAARHARSNRAG